MVQTGIKTFFDFMTTQNKIKEPKEETANSDQIHDLLNESHALLRATANFESEPSTIDKPQNTTEFISDHEKIANILYTSGLTMESLKDFVTKEEQLKEKELETLRHQLLNILQTTKSDPSTLPSESMSNQREKKIYVRKTGK